VAAKIWYLKNVRFLLDHPVVAIADVYNINVAQVLHLDNSSLKGLFWEHMVNHEFPVI